MEKLAHKIVIVKSGEFFIEFSLKIRYVTRAFSLDGFPFEI